MKQEFMATSIADRLLMQEKQPPSQLKILSFCDSRTLTRSRSRSGLLPLTRSEMAGSRVAHATLKGPSVVKELCIGLALGLVAGGLWKMHHWNEQRKVRTFYDLLEKGEISVVAEE
ncbi:hypothetical protein QYF36_025785 [Acer negundo]|nr:hypothetical protein QYF36_025785 [Acer negundo]